MSKPNVLILYNDPVANGQRNESEAGVLVERDAVAAALETLGYPFSVVAVTSFAEVAPALAASSAKVVFNLVEGFAGDDRKSNEIPSVCEASGKAYTGAGTRCLTLCHSKWISKLVMQGAGLPVPGGRMVQPGQQAEPGAFPNPPYIVKPVDVDASEGIHAESSIIHKPGDGLVKAVAYIHSAFNQAALVEEYFGNRELNVSVLETADGPHILPLAEIDFSAFAAGMPRIVDYAAKWIEQSFAYNNTPRVIPAPLTHAVAERVRELTRAAWDALGCHGYARVDFRLDDQGGIAILEVNPNPDISPDAGFAAALNAAGIAYSDFVQTAVTQALKRRPPKPGRRSEKVVHAGLSEGIQIRRTDEADRQAIVDMVRNTGFFHEFEIEVAAEVVDEAVAKGAEGDYQSFTALDNGVPTGWICFGKTPCTLGTYDIYWIAVAPHQQGQGVGKKLLRHAEEVIREHDGLLSVIETSGRPLYDATRGFYLKLGYREEARLRDFYGPGDAKVIYLKDL